MFNKAKKDVVDNTKEKNQPTIKIEQKKRTVKIKHKFWQEIKQLDTDNQALKNGLIKKFMQREDLTNKIRVDHRDVMIIERKLKEIVDKCGIKQGEQFRLTPNEDELDVLYFVSKMEQSGEDKKEEKDAK